MRRNVLTWWSFTHALDSLYPPGVGAGGGVTGLGAGGGGAPGAGPDGTSWIAGPGGGGMFFVSLLLLGQPTTAIRRTPRNATNTMATSTFRIAYYSLLSLLALPGADL